MAETQVNTYTAGNQASPAIAADAGGNYVIVWVSADGGSYDGIYAQRFDAAGTAQGIPFQVNTVTTRDATAPQVAMDSSGNFAVAWTDPNASPAAIYVRLYDPSGAATSTPIQVFDATSTAPSVTCTVSSIAMNPSGDFVVTWRFTETTYTYAPFFSSNDTTNTYARCYGADGTAKGGSFKVNTTTGGSDSDVAMAPDGSFVVTWTSAAGQDGSAQGIYAQRYDASGTKIGSEFLVNTTTSGAQTASAVAMAADGAFIVAWQSSDASATGIYAQRYDSSGTKVGGEFLVNTTTASDQNVADIAIDSTGRFVITWQSYNQDGDGTGAYCQWFAADGTALGGETRVNTTTTGPQQAPAVAIGTAGTAVFAWPSFGQDGSGWGVFTDSASAPAAVCFLRGTLILTSRGEVPVEHLREGDLVATKFGGLRPIRWIGTQSFHPRFAGATGTPIRFAPGSLGQGMPSAELFVSPGHAMLVGDVLAHAGALVNGTTIAQPPFHGDSIDYFHLDLGAHDCVLANSAWAESYFEDHNRNSFHNAADFRARHPRHAPVRQATCLPILTAEHAEMAALRARLAPVAIREAA